MCSEQNEVSWQCVIGPEWNVPDISKSCLQLLRAHWDACRWVVCPSTSIRILFCFLKAKKCHISWCDWVEPVLVWYCLFFIPFGYLVKGYGYLYTSRVWVFEGIVFYAIWVYIPCRTSIPRPNCPSMNMVEIGTDSYNNLVYKDSLTLTYPLNMNIWLVIQFWYLWVGSSIPLLMLIIDTMHSSIYQTKSSWNLLNDGVEFDFRQSRAELDLNVQ